MPEVNSPPVPAGTELVVMGTGTSVGVPVVGCECEICTSGNPKNHRLRSGVFVRAPEGEFVIDAGPELRLQLLASGATLIQAAVFTHAHADHVMGLDDLRIFSFRLEKQLMQTAREAAESRGEAFDEDEFRSRGLGKTQLFCEEIVEESIRNTFSYAFVDPSKLSHKYAAPRLEFERIAPGEPIELLGLSVLPIRLQHGKLPILGFRIGNVAFCTDVSSIPADSRDLLQDLDVLIIDALRETPHPTHLSVDQAVKWSQKLGAKQTYLTHMSHELDYDQLKAALPDGIEPAYDGLRIPLS